MTTSERIKRGAISALIVGGLLAFLLLTPRYRFEWHTVWRDRGYGELLFEGLRVTALVSLGALVIGLVLGVGLALMRMSRRLVLDQTAATYVELVRGTPLLVQLYVAMYCVSVSMAGMLGRAGADERIISFVQDEVLVGVIALGCFAAAYVSEIVRAAIQSIDKGQVEAALSQGMSRAQIYRYILFPQALRRMVPPLTNEAVNIVKDSSLLSVIAVHELAYHAGNVRTKTGAAFEVLLPVALMYLCINFPLSRLARRLELRLAE